MLANNDGRPADWLAAGVQDTGTDHGEAEPEAMLVANMALINRVVRFTARRHRLSPVETDDLASLVYLRLVENDYAVLRKFEHRCRLQTFLTVVIARICLDRFTQQSGRWRPSAEARRLGMAAVEFERLIGRDHLPFEEAMVSLASTQAALPPRAKLARLAMRLLGKPRRRHVYDVDLSTIPDQAAAPSVLVARKQLRRHTARIRLAIVRLLQAMEPLDRQLIDLHFNEGLGVAQIARRLKLAQRPLYGRLTKLLAQLRRGLEGDPAIAGILPELIESWNDSGDRGRFVK